MQDTPENSRTYPIGMRFGYVSVASIENTNSVESSLPVTNNL